MRTKRRGDVPDCWLVFLFVLSSWWISIAQLCLADKSAATLLRYATEALRWMQHRGLAQHTIYSSTRRRTGQRARCFGLKHVLTSGSLELLFVHDVVGRTLNVRQRGSLQSLVAHSNLACGGDIKRRIFRTPSLFRVEKSYAVANCTF